jgi:hypothetical protein
MQTNLRSTEVDERARLDQEIRKILEERTRLEMELVRTMVNRTLLDSGGSSGCW